MCAQFVTSNRVTCPRCGSLNVTPMGKSGSSTAERMIFGKMMMGLVGAMMGLVGAMMGYFASSEKYDFHCANCGEVFSINRP